MLIRKITLQALKIRNINQQTTLLKFNFAQKSEAEEHEKKMSDLFDQIEKQYTKKNILPENSFSNYRLYLNTSDLDKLSRKLGTGMTYNIFWITLSGLTFQFIHPWATIAPALFCLQGMISFIRRRKFYQSIFYSIDLCQNGSNQFLLIKVLKIASSSQAIKMLFLQRLRIMIQLMFEICRKKEKLIHMQTFWFISYQLETNKKLNYFIIFNTKDKNGDIFSELKLLLNPDFCEIENPQLLKMVIEGETILNWKYIQIERNETRENNMNGDEDQNSQKNEKS